MVNLPKLFSNFISNIVSLNSYKSANHYWAFDVANADIVTDLIGRKRCTLTGWFLSNMYTGDYLQVYVTVFYDLF